MAPDSAAIYEPRHEIYNNQVCATSKASDQPAHTHGLIIAWIRAMLVAGIFVKLLNEHHLEFLSLKGGCTGSSEFTLVKTQHCWKLHVTVHISKITILFKCSRGTQLFPGGGGSNCLL